MWDKLSPNTSIVTRHVLHVYICEAPSQQHTICIRNHLPSRIPWDTDWHCEPILASIQEDSDWKCKPSLPSIPEDTDWQCESPLPSIPEDTDRHCVPILPSIQEDSEGQCEPPLPTAYHGILTDDMKHQRIQTHY